MHQLPLNLNKWTIDRALSLQAHFTLISRTRYIEDSFVFVSVCSEYESAISKSSDQVILVIFPIDNQSTMVIFDFFLRYTAHTYNVAP